MDFSTPPSDFINSFISEFELRYGIKPQVYYHEKNVNKVIDITVLENMVNQYFAENYPVFYTPDGIRRRTRKAITVLMRMVFYKLAFEMGYTKNEIARHIKLDHATIIFGITRVTKQLSENKAATVNAYNSIHNQINSRDSSPTGAGVRRTEGGHGH